MSTDDTNLDTDSGEQSKLGEQFKNAEAEAKPYVGTDDSDAADSADDAVAAGADPDKQDTTDTTDPKDGTLPGIAAATGLRRN